MHNGENVLNLVPGYVGVCPVHAEELEQRLEAVEHVTGDGHGIEPIHAHLYNAGTIACFQYGRERRPAQESGVIFEVVSICHAGASFLRLLYAYYSGRFWLVGVLRFSPALFEVLGEASLGQHGAVFPPHVAVEFAGFASL